MSMTDPIADLLTHIRNAIMAKHEVVEICTSLMKQAIVQVLKDEGFIKDFEVIEQKPQGSLRIELKYFADGRNAISKLHRESKPGSRKYFRSSEIPRVRGGLGIGVLSTNQGVLTDKAARTLRVGGELLCTVW